MNIEEAKRITEAETKRLVEKWSCVFDNPNIDLNLAILLESPENVPIDLKYFEEQKRLQEARKIVNECKNQI